MELIDQEAFRKRLILKYHCVPVVGIPYGDNWESLDEALSDEPTIDAAPVVHGHISNHSEKSGRMDKRILDVACGSKMFWFDKNNPDVEFCDNRVVERHEYYPNRYIEISPDTVCDFTKLPFEDEMYHLVVFDPPHLKRAGEKSWTAMKYGVLSGEWKEILKAGFKECFRVLDDNGVLIFKWSEIQIPLSEILPLSPYPPLFGNRSGRNNKTHWLCFMKPKF